MSERDETEGVQRRTLLVVLILNAALFVGLGIGGLLADSSALLANAWTMRLTPPSTSSAFWRWAAP